AATAPDAPAPTIRTSGMRSNPFSAIRNHLPSSPAQFSDRGPRCPRPEDQAQRQSADVANILKAAGVGAGGEQSPQRRAVAIEDPTIRVDSQPPKGERDRGLKLQRMKRRVGDGLGAHSARDFEGRL